MTGEAVMEKKADANLALEMESYASAFKFQTVQRWNYVAPGKKISQAGFTNGLRFTSHTTGLENLKQSISHLEGFESSLAQSSRLNNAFLR